MAYKSNICKQDD